MYTSQGNISLYPVMSGNSIQSDIYTWMRRSLLDIQDNWYEGIVVDSINIDISVLPGVRRYWIKELVLKKREFKPGEEVDLSVIIGRYRKPDTTISLNFHLPDEPCELMVMVSGRDEFLSHERIRVPLNFEFDDFSDWKKFINSLPSRDRVIFSLYKKGRAIGTEGGELKDIPFSLHSILNKNNNSVIHNFFPIHREETALSGPVIGVVTEKIEVRR